MFSVLLLGLVFVALSLSVPSLWENPPDGRFSRQRRAGIFHRLLAKLWRSFALGFFMAYGWLVGFLCRLGSPPWLVNSTRLFVPDFLMRAGARAFLHRQEERDRLQAYDYWQSKCQADEAKKGGKP